MSSSDHWSVSVDCRRPVPVGQVACALDANPVVGGAAAVDLDRSPAHQAS